MTKKRFDRLLGKGGKSYFFAKFDNVTFNV